MNNLPLVGGGNKPFYTGLNFVVKTLETGHGVPNNRLDAFIFIIRTDSAFQPPLARLQF